MMHINIFDLISDDLKWLILYFILACNPQISPYFLVLKPRGPLASFCTFHDPLFLGDFVCAAPPALVALLFPASASFV